MRVPQGGYSESLIPMFLRYGPPLFLQHDSAEPNAIKKDLSILNGSSGVFVYRTNSRKKLSETYTYSRTIYGPPSFLISNIRPILQGSSNRLLKNIFLTGFVYSFVEFVIRRAKESVTLASVSIVGASDSAQWEPLTALPHARTQSESLHRSLRSL